MPRNAGYVWEYRFREKVNGKSVERTRVIGTLKDYPTESAARRRRSAARRTVWLDVDGHRL
jgi:hypothetical protein